MEQFINNYNDIKNEHDFEQYIYNLIEKIIQGFSFKKSITHEIGLLIRNNKNNFKNIIDSFINIYAKITKNYIDTNLKEKPLEYLDMQVKVENEKGKSINNKNKRNREEFINSISHFLKDNFYYISQKYLVYRFIVDLFESFSEKLNINIYDKMVKYLSEKEVDVDYKKIYLAVLENFEKKINELKNENGKIYE